MTFKAQLIFPPQWSPQNPFFALASLAGHLRAQGYEVLLRDLNVEFYDDILTPDYLHYTEERLKLDREYLEVQCRLKQMVDDISLDFQFEAARFLQIVKVLDESPRLISDLASSILDAKETFRDPRRFYNPDFLVEAFQVIDKALEVISLPYYPSRLSFNFFEQPQLELKTAELIKFATRREGNIFYDYFKNHIDSIIESESGYIGISINAFSQVLPGLTLAAMLKEAAPSWMTIGVGGNFFARVRDELKRHPEFFQTFCDILTCGEGEDQMSRLLGALDGDRDFSNVPNILYLDEEDVVRSTPAMPPLHLDELGIQDLAGLPLNRYFTPELVCTIQASKGCYWGKCTFCDTDYGIAHDVKNMDHLVAEIKHLRDTYGVRHFQFIDEAIPPLVMKDMADRFLAEDLNIHWFSNGRLETDFTPEILDHLQKAGISMVLWGVESGSERIMRLINKGIDLDRRMDILKASTQAGIWNFAYIFFGFPTETEEEAMSTIEEICSNTDIIHSYGRSVFTLGKHSILFEDAAKYGIIDVIEDAEELSTNLHYRSSQGLTDAQVDEMMRRCTHQCAEAYRYALWFFLRYRENIHLYVSRYGLDYVRNYSMERAVKPRAEVW